MFNGEQDAHQKANDIAEWLGTYDNHLTHGRPIDIKTASAKGLKIVKLEDDQVLQENVLSVFHASILTIEITNCVKMIENDKGIGVFIHNQNR